jgi:ribosomal protein L33
MYKIVPWSEDLDLTDFYAEAGRRGFANNASQFAMVERIQREREWAVWILYQDSRAVGAAAAHSIDLFPNAYRICTRTCTFAEAHPRQGLITTRKLIEQHQNLTAQFFIPACIDWCGADSNMYISSHNGTTGTERIVHNVYCPTLEKIGTLTNAGSTLYRGHEQTFWKLNTKVFQEQLEQRPRW